ncbi:hypothetical protein [Arenicella xantha]|uniref:Uncharacterized protein n=1 Tax=Arenicella xantha TaxID=644221 RepID=A0A395JHE0_9GAMM|nr:hypothetical protein [Arenicella xantha]RBP47049.1 hypothetical protein DFR28_11012 [Arenicella xantha]
MSAKQILLDRLIALQNEDAEHDPVVSLDEYFYKNDDEWSIAPNNWGDGRPSIKDIYARFKKIESRPDVQGVYVGLHGDWMESQDDEESWPSAENIHVISSASQFAVEGWVEGMEADSVGADGWPYGKHKLAPEPALDYYLYTVYWD